MLSSSLFSGSGGEAASLLSGSASPADMLPDSSRPGVALLSDLLVPFFRSLALGRLDFLPMLVEGSAASWGLSARSS